jgi:hypothetical protein
MYIEHRSDRVTPQWAAFHGASANPASLSTTFFSAGGGFVIPKILLHENTQLSRYSRTQR